MKNACYVVFSVLTLQVNMMTTTTSTIAIEETAAVLSAFISFLSIKSKQDPEAV